MEKFITSTTLAITYCIYSLKLYKLDNDVGKTFCSLMGILVGIHALNIDFDLKTNIEITVLLFITFSVIKTFYKMKGKSQDKDSNSKQRNSDI